jgi:hypothetical protein
MVPTATASDPLANPYTPAPGTRPRALPGRDEEIALFRNSVGGLLRGEPARHLLLQGRFGCGTTVLLRAFEDLAEAAGVTSDYIEVASGRELAPDLARYVERLAGRLDLSDDELRQLRGQLDELGTMTVQDGPALRLVVDDKAAAVTSRLTRDLVRLFVGLGELAQRRDTSLALVIDEIHRADDVGFRALLSALIECRELGVPLLLVAGGLPTMPRLSERVLAQLDQILDQRHVGELSEDAAASALAVPARSLGVDWAPDAVEAVVAWAEGNPWCLQLAGRHSWNLAGDDTIDLTDARAGIAAASADLRGLGEAALRRATTKELGFAQAIAEFGPGPYDEGHLLAAEEKYGLSPDFLTPALGLVRLLGKEIIVADYEYTKVEFVLPKLHELLTG